MLHRLYGKRATLRALTGLDFGLRVRVYPRSSQRSMFCGPQNLAARQLISEFAEDLSGLRVYSYAMRGQLEDALSVLRQWALEGQGRGDLAVADRANWQPTEGTRSASWC